MFLYAFSSLFSPHCWRKQLFTLSKILFLFVFCPVFSSCPPLSGGFSETYAALCDYNGISCKEEVQWVRAVGLCLCRCECFCVVHTALFTKWGGSYTAANRLMGNVAPRMWTPSITPRTTESLTCWTSATWRAGEGEKEAWVVENYNLQNVLPH